MEQGTMHTRSTDPELQQSTEDTKPGRHRRPRYMPWWGHMIVAGLILAGLVASVFTGNPLIALLAVVAALFAEDAIRHKHTAASIGVVAAVVCATGAAAITLATLTDITAWELAAGTVITWLVLATSWRVHRATHQLDRIVTEEAPR